MAPYNNNSKNAKRRNSLYSIGKIHFTRPRCRVSLCEYLPLQILTAASEIAPRDQQAEKVTVRVPIKRMVLVIERLSIGLETIGVFHACHGKTHDPRPMRDDGRSERMSFPKTDGRDE